MNRSLLIAICDFMILSLLSFGVLKKEPKGKKIEDQPSLHAEYYAALETSLDSQKKLQQKTERELSTSRERAAALEAERQQLASLSASQQGNLEALSKDLETTSQKEQQLGKSLEGERSSLEKLRQEHVLTRSELDTKLSELKEREEKLKMAMDSIRTLSREIERSREHNMGLEEKMSQQQKASEENSQLLATRMKEQHQLLGELHGQMVKIQQTDVIASEEARLLRGRIEESIVNEKKTLELAQQIKKQAEEIGQEHQIISRAVEKTSEASLAIQKELREKLPQSSHDLFRRFVETSVHISMEGEDKQLLNTNREEKRQLNTNKYREELKGVVVHSPSGSWVLLHHADTLLGWAGFSTSTLKSCRANFEAPHRQSISRMYILKEDPRLVAIELKGQPREKCFELASGKFPFEDALLVDPRSGDYTQCLLKIDADRPGYVKIPGALKSRLFERFRVRPGQLIFAKNGPLIGMMVDSETCKVLETLETLEVFELGDIGEPEKHEEKVALWRNRLESAR